MIIYLTMGDKMNMKILMFESKKLCYASSESFLHSIGNELVKCGYEVEYCELEEGKEDRLEEYIGRRFLAAFDINSVITNAILNDKDYFVDALKIPFFNIIVDHPMHLHDRLSVPLDNYNVICIDKEHCEYISKHYPNIKNVIYMPFGGTLSRYRVPFKDRKYEIFFPGTYVPPYQYRERLVRQDPELLRIAMKTFDIMKKDEFVSFEKALLLADRTYMASIDGKLEVLSNLERFVRALFRSQAISCLLESGREVTVAGENWFMYDEMGNNNLKILPACGYDKMLAYIADSKVVFNVQPFFLYGPHDRVMNAAINGAIPFTDSCSFLDDNFNNNEDIIIYKRNGLERIPEIVTREFECPDRLEYIAGNAQKKALDRHTWEQRVHIIADRLEKCK